ncbi:MAG: hypothetical protein WC371_05920 [Parachlamydiales bacterium]|jgi:processive 1,2-diacylglycerol beta-glucosyltransferase
MSKVFSSLAFFLCCSFFIPAFDLPKAPLRPKVLVFTSNIGGGHKSPTEAIAAALKDQYEIETVNFSEKIAAFIEPVSKITKNEYNAEQFFSFIARQGWNGLANQISEYSLKKLDAEKLDAELEKALLSYLKKTKPDLVISVIGFVNYPIARATDKLKIPFIIIPTDLDQTIANHGFQKKLGKPAEKGFPFLVYAPAFDHFEINKTIRPFSFPLKQIKPIGFPLRPQFFEKKDPAALKNAWQIPSGKPVIMLLLGALGGNNTYDWAKAISKLNRPLHLIVCIGSNETLGKKLQSLKTGHGFSMTVVKYTPKIADLMSLSDLLIIKPGTNSVLEALACRKPILVDLTNGEPLKIEQFNCLFLKQYQLGCLARKKEDLAALLKKPKLPAPRNNPLEISDSFAANLSDLVRSLLKKAEKTENSPPSQASGLKN